MARPLSYPFDELKENCSFSRLPAIRTIRSEPWKRVDTLTEARTKAERYAAKHFPRDRITVTSTEDGMFCFTRVLGEP